MTDLEQFRQSKDHFFKHDPHSPLTPPQRDSFEGLAYYDENPDLRFELKIEPYEVQDTTTMQTSTGDVADYIRWGRLEFEVGGQAAQLTVYSAVVGGGYFLPFMDATNGDETYSAGRYLEVEPLPNGKLLVDFNMAYNPYCAYNPPQSLFEKMGMTPRMLWSCPVPPKENRLSVPILAGEKRPTGLWVEEEYE
jgi:uncharacterized protein (DUF1684 family)